MHAFLINLPSSKDRLKAAEAELSKENISFTVVEAILGRDLKHPRSEFSKWGYQLCQGRRRIDAEVGCYLSHLKAIQYFLDSDEDYGLILEDDIKIPKNLIKLVNTALKSAKFDMLRLSSVNSGRWSKTIPLIDNHFLGVAFSREKGAGAYVINRNAAKKILTNYLPMRLPYDHRFDLEWFDGIKTLGISPPPITQSGFKSQIQVNVRSYYLPSYLRYWTVFPCRAFWEISRFFSRFFCYLELRRKLKNLAALDI